MSELEQLRATAVIVEDVHTRLRVAHERHEALWRRWQRTKPPRSPMLEHALTRAGDELRAVCAEAEEWVSAE